MIFTVLLCVATLVLAKVAWAVVQAQRYQSVQTHPLSLGLGLVVERLRVIAASGLIVMFLGILVLHFGSGRCCFPSTSGWRSGTRSWSAIREKVTTNLYIVELQEALTFSRHSLQALWPEWLPRPLCLDWGLNVGHQRPIRVSRNKPASPRHPSLPLALG